MANGGTFTLISLSLKSFHLGMLTRLFVMLSTTLPVRLKIESLSGFTDLVVSMTNMSGGFNT